MRKLALCTLLAVAGSSFAFSSPGWFQPWTPKLPAWESRILNCRNPQINNNIALDDFSFDFDYSITQINWWGTLAPQISIANSNYYIAIYKDDGCLPALGSKIWSTCVVPKVELVGGDCQDKQVYKFSSTHLPINLGPGRYWIQISENDRLSSRPGVIDFMWSSHESIVKCSAVQVNAFGGMTTPLIDPCYNLKVDLAFEIY